MYMNCRAFLYNLSRVDTSKHTLWECRLIAEDLPSMHEILGSIPSIIKQTSKNLKLICMCMSMHVEIREQPWVSFL